MRYEAEMDAGITIDAAAQGEFPPDLFTVEVEFNTEKRSVKSVFKPTTRTARW